MRTAPQRLPLHRMGSYCRAGGMLSIFLRGVYLRRCSETRASLEETGSTAATADGKLRRSMCKLTWRLAARRCASPRGDSRATHSTKGGRLDAVVGRRGMYENAFGGSKGFRRKAGPPERRRDSCSYRRAPRLRISPSLPLHALYTRTEETGLPDS